LDEISLAYAITIHKSQGSEFPAGDPLATQHYMLLLRNLIYTGITRGKKLVVVIGQKKALSIAVRNDRPQRRYSGLLTSRKGRRAQREVPSNRKPPANRGWYRKRLLTMLGDS
jgi:exodeoxyribonuclease V alpha subunit